MDGTIGEITSRGPKDGKIIEEAAINMFKKLPKLQPAKQRGKPVRVTYMIPIMFRLE